jgi:RHS repeat-associated protein
MTMTAQSGYTGTAYLQVLPDTDRLYPTGTITASPALHYPIYFTNPGTYTVWLRGYPTNAAGDSAYISMEGQVVGITGFEPRAWTWTDGTTSGATAQLAVEATGLYTLSLWMREDGLRIDRLLLTTDTTYLPSGFGPVETVQQVEEGPGRMVLLDRTLVYTYDNLYRLTGAAYSTGELYEYAYDPVGNRLQQIINGDTTEYLYDAANRLTNVGGVPYSFDANGNLLRTGVVTHVFNAANYLVEASGEDYTLHPIYNGVGDRIGQTVAATTTHFALDVLGLPEVIYTSEGNKYLHLPGAIVTENAAGESRYLLSDGLGSVRQAVDDTGEVVAYHEFDPYGNPISLSSDPSNLPPYGYSGEWWENEIGLLYLRARWYTPGDGIFLSRDPMEDEPPYQYVQGNPVNRSDPSGLFPEWVIRNSLEGASIKAAFSGSDEWGRAGLYHLLLDAEDGDAVWPSIVDFAEESWRTIKHPLRTEAPVSAYIGCDRGKLSFNYMNSPINLVCPALPGSSYCGYNSSLPQFLTLLDIAANQLRVRAPWRQGTLRYHYYARSKNGNHYGYTFYDDFGDETLLPDVVSSSWGLGLGVGFEKAKLVDRYGIAYRSWSGTIGIGLQIKHLKPLVNVGRLIGELGGSLGEAEGYSITDNSNPPSESLDPRRSKGRIPREAQLNQRIKGFGIGWHAALLAGYSMTTPVPPTGSFHWFTRGIDVGIVASGGYTFESYPGGEGWDWLDGLNGESHSYGKDSLPQETSSYTGNECTCGN